MNPNIKAAAESHAAETPDHFRSGTIGDFAAGAAFAFKEMEQLREAAKAVVSNLERDDEPMLMDNLRAALSATESYFEIDKI